MHSGMHGRGLECAPSVANRCITAESCGLVLNVFYRSIWTVGFWITVLCMIRFSQFILNPSNAWESECNVPASQQNRLKKKLKSLDDIRLRHASLHRIKSCLEMLSWVSSAYCTWAMMQHTCCILNDFVQRWLVSHKVQFDTSWKFPIFQKQVSRDHFWRRIQNDVQEGICGEGIKSKFCKCNHMRGEREHPCTDYKAARSKPKH